MSTFQYKHLQANESIQAYLRSFLHEKHRWNELVEATLLYGIHCLSQNYPLQTLNVDQVQHITRTLLRKPQHYFVHQSKSHERSTSSFAPKPSSAWRTGSSRNAPLDGPDISTNIVSETSQSKVTEAPLVIRDGRRDIDEWQHVLGKPFLDLAWRSYASTTGYPSPRTVSSDVLAISFNQLKTQAKLTPFESGDTLSFLDYLRGFVVHCISHKEPGAQRQVAEPSAPPSQPSRQALSQVKQPTQKSTPRRENVVSKVKAELDARKQQVLRVKKTNTQRMHEALARSRLAAYEADSRHKSRPLHSQPALSAMGPGAKALEIAHSFSNSPFFQSTAEIDNQIGGTIDTAEPVSPSELSSVRMELYGNPEQSPFDKGCVQGAQLRPQRSKHDFKGWLGDYGPAHTKSVIPAEWNDLDDEDTLWLRSTRRDRTRKGWELYVLGNVMGVLRVFVVSIQQANQKMKRLSIQGRATTQIQRSNGSSMIERAVNLGDIM
ncbi:hypothetical protein AeRB84_012780 [Aphanomyces euteiches]|nr:hypothetical protein AeRB84_012780 [Aphanomyces euteiches]